MDRLMETIVAMTPGAGASAADAIGGSDDPIISPAPAPQMMLLDFFFPGFSIFSAAVQKTLHIDLNLYIPLVLLAGGLTFVWQYFSEYAWKQVEAYLMSVVDIRTDDEIYNMLMTWVASQRFAQGARRFVVNTNLSSRSWFLYKWDEDEDEDGEGAEVDSSGRQKKKALAYTPTFGSHWFWFKGRLLIFRRTQGAPQSYGYSVSEKEEISISCFGRNPWVLKELLHEARTSYMKRDEAKTLIYRGTTRSGSTEPTWQRCMSRASRPFSTVILNDKVKKDLIDDVTDYLDPNTRRWYSNRGIPYRRGYLLYGPPGTGKSSLSLALAGFFKMRIYIVSLSSVTSNEENLASLFAELPRRCVVLLEDIDTAGLTHTRDNGNGTPATDADSSTPTTTDMVPGQLTPGNPAGGGGNKETSGRLSLSGLLNILDGVASQEGRVLIMTTNHIEKLDKALIRPGRVDMTVKFDKADAGMTAAIFRAIFAPLEGDDAPRAAAVGTKYADLAEALEADRAAAAARAREREATLARVEGLAEEFAGRVPAHEFSPAELQGYLLKNKRDPEAAVEGAAEWVVETRKDRKEKELRQAEEKRKKEEDEKKKKEEEEAKKKKEEEEKKEEERKKVEEEKKKVEEEKKKKEEEEKRRRKKSAKRKSKKSSSSSRRKGRKEESDESGSSDSDSDASDSEAEASGAEVRKARKSAKAAAAVEEKKEAAPTVAVEAATAKPVVIVVAPPAALKTEESNKTVVAALETEGKEKAAAPVSLEGHADDGKVQQGADSGYGTP